MYNPQTVALESNFHSQVLFCWSQIHLKKTTVGNRGTVRDINEKDKVTHFPDHHIHEKMTQGRDWNKHGYIVDLYALQNSEGEISVYKIIKLYRVIEYACHGK